MKKKLERVDWCKSVNKTKNGSKTFGIFALYHIYHIFYLCLCRRAAKVWSSARGSSYDGLPASHL